MIMNTIGTVGGRRFTNSRTSDTTFTYLLFDRKTSADIPTLTVNNMGSASSTVTLSLRSSAGAVLATAQRPVPASGAVRESFSTLFPSASLPLDGYLVLQATSAVRPLLVNNPASRPDEVSTLVASSASPATFPFFVFGGGYSSVLELINPSDTQAVQVTLNAFSPTGTALTAQPLVRTIAVNEKQNFDFASIFGVGSQNNLTVGYFSIALQPVVITNPFANPPQVYGILRFGINTASTVIPFLPDAGSQFFLTPASETSTAYTGLAFMNPIAAVVSVTIDAFSSSGTALGTLTFNVPGNTTKIQLLRELIPLTLGNDNMLVRVSTTGGTVRLISFRGTLALDELLYLKGETTP
jgi:hypothetical protein